MKRVAIVLAVLASVSVPVGAHAKVASVLPEVTAGYVTTAPGVHLHYALIRPSEHGRFPVAMIYSPYGDGSDPQTVGDDSELGAALLKAGYALLGVNVRGTGCSTGTFDPFRPHEARDGARVVEWAAAQPWSDGRVGMYGASAHGINQFGVAGQRPVHLRAIAPFHFVADLYRDVGYAGGLFNVSFAPAWALGMQPAYSAKGAGYSIARGDARCARTVARRQHRNARANPVLPVVRHPFDGAFYRERNPNKFFAQIDVPVLACMTWQDDEVGSRGSEALDELDPSKTWVLAANGHHGMCEDPIFEDYLVRFMDRFVKGYDNGFDKTPHVTLMHEARFVGDRKMFPGRSSVPGAALPATPSEPGWATTHSTWPVAVAPATYELGNGSYRYPLASSGNEDGDAAGNSHTQWKAKGASGGFVAFTSDALRDDAEFLGPGSANLWLKSTSTDTDIQITLSEIRPDGQEMYIQRGWLRASHRKLDPMKSTPVRPYHTHRAVDAEALTPGEPTLLRVELLPFNHVFRAGSRIRLTVDAPTANTGLFAFNYLKQPATNTILDAQLVLGLVPGGRALRPYPPCDSVISQACRPAS